MRTRTVRASRGVGSREGLRARRLRGWVSCRTPPSRRAVVTRSLRGSPRPAFALQLGEVLVGDGAERRRFGLGACGAPPLCGGINASREQTLRLVPRIAGPGERHRWTDAAGKELLFTFEAIGETPDPSPVRVHPKLHLRAVGKLGSASRQRPGRGIWHRSLVSELAASMHTVPTGRQIPTRLPTRATRCPTCFPGLRQASANGPKS